MKEKEKPEIRPPDFEDAEKVYKIKPRKYTSESDFKADDDWEDDSFYTNGPDEFEG